MLLWVFFLINFRRFSSREYYLEFLKFIILNSQLEVWAQCVHMCVLLIIYIQRGIIKKIFPHRLASRERKREKAEEGYRWVKVMTVIIISHVFNWDNDPEEDNKTPKGKISISLSLSPFCHVPSIFSLFNFLETTALNFISLAVVTRL